MGRIERLLREALPDDSGVSADPEFEHVRLPPVTPGQLLHSAFPPIARCAGGAPEVMAWMEKALLALEHHPDRAMARAARGMRQELAGDQ